MEHIKYYKKIKDIENLETRPLVYYVEETNKIFYFDIYNKIESIGSFKDGVITINTDKLNKGEEYTLSFATANGTPIESWMDITKFTVE